MASTANRLLDPQALPSALETEDAASLVEFYELFANLTREAWPQLVSASSTDDFATVGAIAHKLVSSSATIGAMPLAAVLRTLEGLAGSQHRESIRACIEDASTLVAGSLCEVDSHIDQLNRR